MHKIQESISSISLFNFIRFLILLIHWIIILISSNILLYKSKMSKLNHSRSLKLWTNYLRRCGQGQYAETLRTQQMETFQQLKDFSNEVKSLIRSRRKRSLKSKKNLFYKIIFSESLCGEPTRRILTLILTEASNIHQ